MTRSRIAIFEGYGAAPRRYSRYGGQIVSNPRPAGQRGPFGGPIMMNPRPAGQAGPFGRRAYYVPAERGYGPVERPGGRRPVVRKAYRVKRTNTPAMKRAQAKFKKAAKRCAKRRSGSFQVCMRRELKKKR